MWVAHRSRTVLVVSILAVAGATCLSYVGTRANWLGSWAETSTSVDGALLVSGALISAISSWLLGEPRRHGWLSMLSASSRSLARVWTRPLASVTVVMVGAVLLGALPAFVGTGFAGPTDHFPVARLFVLAAAVFAYVCWGGFVGLLLPAYVAPPVAAALAYVAVGAVYGHEDFSLMSLVLTDPRDMTYDRATLVASVTQCAWFCGLGMFFMSLRLAVGSTKTATAGVAGVLAAMMLVVSPQLRVPVPSRSQLVCTTGSPISTCVTRAHAAALKPVDALVQKVVRPMSGLYPPGARFIEMGSRSPQPTSDGLSPDPTRVVLFNLQSGTQGDAAQFDDADMLAQLEQTILIAPCSVATAAGLHTAKNGRLLANTNVAVAYWLSQRLAPGSSAKVTRYSGLDLSPEVVDYRPVMGGLSKLRHSAAATRQHWFTIHRQQVLACEASPTALDSLG